MKWNLWIWVSFRAPKARERFFLTKIHQNGRFLCDFSTYRDGKKVSAHLPLISKGNQREIKGRWAETFPITVENMIFAFIFKESTLYISFIVAHIFLKRLHLMIIAS